MLIPVQQMDLRFLLEIHFFVVVVPLMASFAAESAVVVELVAVAELSVAEWAVVVVAEWAVVVESTAAAAAESPAAAEARMNYPNSSFQIPPAAAAEHINSAVVVVEPLEQPFVVGLE